MAPTRKGGEKGRSAIKEVEIREYTIDTPKCTHGVAFKKHAPRALTETGKVATKGDGGSRCAHGHQAPRGCPGHRNKDCPTPQPGAVVQET